MAGALGRKLAEIFSEGGYDIKGNDIKSPEEAKLEINYLWKATEDLNRKDIEKYNVIINCAATADRPMGISSPTHTIFNNIIPTTRLLEICKDLEIEKFMQPGSGTAYIGLPEEELPVTEQTVPQPKNPYSASKYMQDTIAMSYYYSHRVPVTILRSGMVYGAGRLAIAPHRFMIQALKEKPIIVFGGKQTRTPTHINDVIEYWKKIIKLPTEKYNGKIFHTVYPTDEKIRGEYSVLEMAELVKEISKSNSEIVVKDYEAGEIVNGKPAREWVISKTADSLGV